MLYFCLWPPVMSVCRFICEMPVPKIGETQHFTTKTDKQTNVVVFEDTAIIICIYTSLLYVYTQQ